MRYISTRGEAPALSFAEVTLAGLASDGGLYVPDRWPEMRREDIAALAGLDYAETAVRILSHFTGDDIAEDDLRAMCRVAYGSFRHEAVVPTVQLGPRSWLMELFHGPTLAFKDVALQLLGQLFERFLGARRQGLTVIGATSGDTGSAAIAGLAGVDEAEVFMLHPHGKISDVQRRQMTTVLSPNIHNIAIHGSFDDAQAMVKRMFRDPDMAAELDMGAINSINWARLAAQVVYYFYSAVRLGAPDRRVAFSVPTGNFGDVFAGYVAARMGLPVERLIVATNVNDILYRALGAGDYSVGNVTATAAPSMDIQVSSNFERLLFDLAGRDAPALTRMMAAFESDRRLSIPADMRAAANIFTPVRVDADAMSLAMRHAQERHGMLVDPHSAIGLAAASDVADSLPADVPLVTLATAHPAKFGDAVERATGERPRLPRSFAGLMEREERYEELPGDYDAVKRFILEKSEVGRCNA